MKAPAPDATQRGSALALLRNVARRYGSAPALIEVLRDVSLTVEHGESIAIVGPSGSGKSTLLNIIGSLDRADSGEVIVDGVDLTTADEKQRTQLRRSRIGFVFQSHHLLPQCSVIENVLVPTLAAARKSPPDAVERARELLRELGLDARMHRLPGQLSGGERQRVAVARSLINQPVLLLADEPTGSLDRDASERLADLLATVNEERNLAVILVTHADHVAKRMQRLLELRDGCLIESDNRALPDHAT
ncbi:MAG: ABC transporter ATP-binding protein [Phycisphaerales bacterium]